MEPSSVLLSLAPHRLGSCCHGKEVVSNRELLLSKEEQTIFWGWAQWPIPTLSTSAVITWEVIMLECGSGDSEVGVLSKERTWNFRFQRLNIHVIYSHNPATWNESSNFPCPTPSHWPSTATTTLTMLTTSTMQWRLLTWLQWGWAFAPISWKCMFFFRNNHYLLLTTHPTIAGPNNEDQGPATQMKAPRMQTTTTEAHWWQRKWVGSCTAN